MISSTKKAITTKKISIMDHLEYRQEWDRLMDLRRRLSEADRAVSERNDAYSQLPEKIKAARAESLENVIGGGDAVELDIAKKIQEELATARSRVRGLAAAEAEQHRRVNALRLKVSTQICKELKSQDRELGHADALKFIEWNLQRIQRIDFFNELEQGNIAFSHDFIPMGNRYGDVRDPNSNAALLLQEYHERGYIEAREIPKQWRDAWYKYAGMTLRTVAV